MDADRLMDRLGMELDVVTAHHRVLEFESVEKLLRDIETKVVSALQQSDRPDFVIETHRRVVERLLDIATQKPAMEADCCRIMEELRRLGYTDLICEVQCELKFARYLMSIAEHAAARQIVSQMHEKAGAAGSEYSYLIDACNIALSQE